MVHTGIMPKAFKSSVIKPIFKTGDRVHVRNYSPNLLITNFTKNSEKLMKKKLTSFLIKYHIITMQQYGFQKGISTEDVLSFVIKNIYDAVDKRQPTIVISLHLAKAFDNVYLKVLYESLDHLDKRCSLHLLKNSENKEFR